MSILNKAALFHQHLSQGMNAHSRQGNVSAKCFSGVGSPRVAVSVSILQTILIPLASVIMYKLLSRGFLCWISEQGFVLSQRVD